MLHIANFCSQARALALPALQERYAEVLGHRDAKFEIRTVRPATADEIKWMAWYLETVATDAGE